MNDQKILQYLARKPDSRAQDIADAMDVELREASDALRELVDAGDVRRYAGLAPNGLTSQLYVLSDDFKASRVGQALSATVAGAVDVAASETSAPAPEEYARPEPAPAISMPVFANLVAAPRMGTHADRALAAMKNGPVSDAEMRVHLGLVDGQYPSVFLKSAVKAGRLHKGVHGWTSGPQPNASKFSPAISAPKDEVTAQFGPTDQPEEQFATPAKADAVEPEATVAEVAAQIDPTVWGTRSTDRPSEFRCGLWSDGVLELQRDGATVATLTRGEGEQLVDFMRRMVVEPFQQAA